MVHNFNSKLGKYKMGGRRSKSISMSRGAGRSGGRGGNGISQRLTALQGKLKGKKKRNIPHASPRRPALLAATSKVPAGRNTHYANVAARPTGIVTK